FQAQSSDDRRMNKRILRNAIFLYGRQVILVGLNLYALRLLLVALGLDDYGLFVAVSGVVSLGTFIPGAVTNVAQRYLSIAIGKEDTESAKSAVSSILITCLFIASLAVAVFETAGLWFVLSALKIAPDRFAAAQTIYQLSIGTFLLGLIASPFIALMISYEEMHLFAFVSIVESVLKLLAVLYLGQATPDNLVEYGYLLLIVSVASTFLYTSICLLRYPVCRLTRLHWDGGLVAHITGFSSWTLFGFMTSTLRSQAVTLLLNQNSNPVTVASRALALTIANQTLAFSANFNTSLYPSIIKSYATEDQGRLRSLVYDGSRLCFYISWIVALPLLIEMDALLGIWLVEVPQHAALFSRLAILETLILTISLPMATVARAPGDVRRYELVLGSMQFALFLASWGLLARGYAPYSVFVAAILINIVMCYARLAMIETLVGLRITDFLVRTLIPILRVVAATATLSLLGKTLLGGGLVNSLMSMAFSLVTSLAFVYAFDVKAIWKEQANQALRPGTQMRHHE
ncbi:MAG: hypothetical protein AAGI88_20155, partial [Pseudomonadota bacterium]